MLLEMNALDRGNTCGSIIHSVHATQGHLVGLTVVFKLYKNGRNRTRRDNSALSRSSPVPPTKKNEGGEIVLVSQTPIIVVYYNTIIIIIIINKNFSIIIIIIIDAHIQLHMNSYSL